MWAPICDLVDLPNSPSCTTELDNAISTLNAAISRCQMAGLSDDEIYGKIVRYVSITREHVDREAARKKKPEYDGTNIVEVLQSVSKRLDQIEDKLNV